ncbi:MAG: preprotein translocase subunit SecE [Clostridia bacterium]|nr:preprotein translocase subunit SecE [Clostridia bacterium]
MAKEVKSKKEKKHFFKDFKAELKKVIWPTPKQLVNNTVAVITIVLITAIIVFALDFAFESMNTFGINKLKEIVDTQNEVSNEILNETSVENTQTQETANEEVQASENVSE